MAKQGSIADEVLTVVQRQLAAAERHILRRPPSTSNAAEMNPLKEAFNKAKQSIQEMKSIFQQVDEKEKQFVENFEKAVALPVDELLELSESPQPPPALLLQSMLQKIGEEIMRMKVSIEKDVRFETGSSLIASQEQQHHLVQMDPALLLDEINRDVQDIRSIFKQLDEQKIIDKSSVKEYVALRKTKLMGIHDEVKRIKASLEKDVHLWRSETGSSSSSSSSASPQPLLSVSTAAVEPGFAAAIHYRLIKAFDEPNRPVAKMLLPILKESEVISKRLFIEFNIANFRSVEQADDLLDRLISKRLVEPIYSKWSLQVVGFKMDPRVHSILASQVGNLVDREFYHVFLQQKTSKEVQYFDWPTKSLINIDMQYVRIDKEWCARAPDLLVIGLGRWQKGLPEYHIEVENGTDLLHGLLQNRIYLHVLSLQGISEINAIPDSIGQLRYLVILDLRACHDLVKLNPKITSLFRLRFLDVSECYQLEYMPKGLGNLSELEVLKGFVIGDSASNSTRKVCSLTELARLKKLRKLSISMKVRSVILDHEASTLRNFEALTSLTIRWSLLPSSELANQHKSTAKIMLSSPPPNLEKLDLRCFPNDDFYPNPALYKELKQLYIRGGYMINLSNRTGSNVLVLRLRYLKSLQIGWEQLHAAFPRLSCLEVHKCDKITSFPRDSEGVWTKEHTDWSSTETESDSEGVSHQKDSEGVWTKEDTDWSSTVTGRGKRKLFYGFH